MAGTVGMEAGPLQSYLDKWLTAHPFQQQALVFVDGARYPGHLALAALEFELLSSAFRIQEVSVAAAKLHWWLQELDEAAQSGGRHPLTQVLFDQPGAARLPASWWTDPVVAALEQLDEGTAADFDAQWAASRRLHGAFARLENGWWYGPQSPFERAAILATGSHLLGQLGQLRQSRDRDGLPLPMSRLARHHLSRQDLGADSPALRQAVREQAEDIARRMDDAWPMAEPLSVFRQLQGQLDRQWLRRLRRVGAAAEMEAGAVAAPRLRSLWQAWRAARQWQQAMGRVAG
ncbi:isoprenoid biosynthesis enzyme family protein [Frateuria aurantia]